MSDPRDVNLDVQMFATSSTGLWEDQYCDRCNKRLPVMVAFGILDTHCSHCGHVTRVYVPRSLKSLREGERQK